MDRIRTKTPPTLLQNYAHPAIRPSIHICDHPRFDPTDQGRNSETQRDTSTKHGTNIWHYHTMWTGQVP